MNRVVSFFADTYRQVKAEEMFQVVAVVLAEHLTVDRLKGMAQAGVGLLDLLKSFPGEGPELAGLDLEDRPELEYLASLRDERVLELLDEAVPEHAAVLREKPEYARKVIADLRKLVGGQGT